MVCIRNYLKLVLRYKFVILDTYHPETVREQGCEDPWQYFRKHWCTGTKPVTSCTHFTPFNSYAKRLGFLNANFTRRIRVFPDKLTAPRLGYKFPAFHGIQNSSIMFTKPRRIQHTLLSCVVVSHYKIILLSTPSFRPPPLSFRFAHQNPVCFPLLCQASCIV